MDYRLLYQSLVDRILKGTGKSTIEQRQAAFNNVELPDPLNALNDKVAHSAYKVTDDDIAAAKSAGYSEDELFELIVSCAAGQASRQYLKGLAALAEAVREGESHAS